MRTTPPSLEQLRQQRDAALSRLSPEQLADVGLDLGTIAAAQAAKVLEVTSSRSFDAITNPDLRRSFEEAWELTSDIYAPLHASPPSPEQLAGAGVDFTSLAASYEHMEIEGLEPQILLTPHLTKSQTIKLFKEKTIDGNILNNPLQARSDGDGLYISEELTDAVWHNLDMPDPDQPHIDHDRLTWTLTVTTSTLKPQHLGVSHRALNGPKGINFYPELLTLSQYVRLQLGRIQTGQPPVDTKVDELYHYSWLRGTFEDASQAPCGRWYPDYGQVRLVWHGVGSQDDDLGARPAVW